MKRFLLVLLVPLLVGTAERHPSPYESNLTDGHVIQELWTYYNAGVDHTAANECIGAPDSNYATARGCGASWQTEFWPPFAAHVSETRVVVTLAPGTGELCTFAFVNWTGSYDTFSGSEDMAMGESPALDSVTYFAQDFEVAQDERVGIRVRDCVDLYDTGSPVQTSGSPDDLCDADDTTYQCGSGGSGADVTRRFHITVYGYWY